MNIEKILKQNNKSLTKERLDMASFMTRKHIFSANDLILVFTGIWRASIFRTIKMFLEIWLIRKVYLWDRWDTYEFIVWQEHHYEHMKCEKCGDVIKFESESICKKIMQEATNIWFKMRGHSVTIVWTCNKCL